MARLVRITCGTCGKEKDVWRASGYPDPKECHECFTLRQNAKRTEHLNGLKALSVEERLSLLEEWTYDFKWPRSVMF